MQGRKRNPRYKTPEELEKKADEYFIHCKEAGEIPTMAGISYFTGFSSREAFTNQGKRNEKFLRTIKRAKLRMYDAKFQLAATGKMNATIFIFDAVNNHGMINRRSENKNNNNNSGGTCGPIPVTVEFVDPPPRDNS